MSEEKKIILEKIDILINKRKNELLKKLSSIHEIKDNIPIITKIHNYINLN
jgi:hypothetical protein